MTSRLLLLFLLIRSLNSPVSCENDMEEELPPELRFMLEQEHWGLHGRQQHEMTSVRSRLEGGNLHNSHIESPAHFIVRDSSQEPTSMHIRNKQYREELFRSRHQGPKRSSSNDRRLPRMPMHAISQVEELMRVPHKEHTRSQSGLNSQETRSQPASEYNVRKLYAEQSDRFPNEVHARPFSGKNYHKEEMRNHYEGHISQPSVSKLHKSKARPSSKHGVKHLHRGHSAWGPPHLHVGPLLASSDRESEPRPTSIYIVKEPSRQKSMTNSDHPYFK